MVMGTPGSVEGFLGYNSDHFSLNLYSNFSVPQDGNKPDNPDNLMDIAHVIFTHMITLIALISDIPDNIEDTHP